MDLPKNITQIGESDHSCKIYVEDYVISYIKQMNRLAENKEMAVALYGIRKEENDISYLFFYGACKLDFLQREVKHFSQAQSQEIEKQRKRYFPDYQFLGYRLLNGEMVEGFHVCEQGICRYIKGYACFYEKNDSMLAYMLDTRSEEPAPEEVSQEKYERVKQRQEERRQKAETEGRSRGNRREGTRRTEDAREEDGEGGALQAAEESSRGRRREERLRISGAAGRKADEKPSPALSATKTVRMMRVGVVGMFALLCVVGLTTMNGYGKLEGLKTAARQLFQELTEQKIPDAGGAAPVMNPQQGQADTLVTEDKLADAIQQENGTEGGQGQTAPGTEGTQLPDSDGMVQGGGTGLGTQGNAQDSASLQEGTGQGAGGASQGSGSGQKTEGTGQGSGGTGQTVLPGAAGSVQGDGGSGQTVLPGAAGSVQGSGGAGQTGLPGVAGSAQGAGGQSDGQSGSMAQTGAEGTGSTGQSAVPGGDGAGQAGTGTQQGTAETPADNGGAASEGSASQPAASQSAPISYTIQPGDTLIGICVRMYGSDDKVKEVCALNNISNPDNIQFGQKILLP